MKKIKSLLICLLLCGFSTTKAQEETTFVVLETSIGKIEFRLYEETPKHKANMIKMVNAHYYDGLPFHRVVKNYIIQTGEAAYRKGKATTALAARNPEFTVPAEFQVEKGLIHRRGAVTAARKDDKENPKKASSASQFCFVWGQVYNDKTLDKVQERHNKEHNGEVQITEEMREVYRTVGGTPNMDGQYTVFGEITEGLELVDSIQNLHLNEKQRPVNDVWIKKATIRKGIYTPKKAPRKTDYVTEYGKLSVNGTQLVSQSGKAVQLKGASFGWHNWWGQYYNENSVNTLVDDWKVSLVRAAIGVEPQGALLSDPDKAYDCLFNVVDAAISKGIYVIIDWHSHDLHPKEAKEFFSMVVSRYKNYPNIIYELFNEPDKETWADVKNYSIELIQKIRSMGCNNIILVGCPNWDQDIDKVADDPITGFDNIMYTLHFYAATHKEELRKKADYALSKNIPLFVSECGGMEASGDKDIDEGSWNEWVKWMNEHNISWAAWSIANKNETCSMLTPETPGEGPWKEENIKPWGKIVKKCLDE